VTDKPQPPLVRFAREPPISRHKDSGWRRGRRLLARLAATRHYAFHGRRMSVWARCGLWLAVWPVRLGLCARAAYTRRNATTASRLSRSHYHTCCYEALAWPQEDSDASRRGRTTARVRFTAAWTLFPLHCSSSLLLGYPLL